MFKLLISLGLIGFVATVRYEDRYDKAKMPFDLRPIANYIGLWTLESLSGRAIDVPPPDQLDYAINPIPKFGARAVNVTHTYFKNGNVVRHDYGFMPVKNATRRDPRVHVAYLTTSSQDEAYDNVTTSVTGWSMMEQGQVKGSQMTFHLKQFLRRSFDVGNGRGDLEIREFERQLDQPNSNQIVMKVRAETNRDTEDYIARYKRVLG